MAGCLVLCFPATFWPHFVAGLGGFFTYVNKQRLQHVENYLKEHPDATLQEAVLESGFNSRQTYYSVKSKL